MVSHLEAIRFIRAMASGRTGPVLCACQAAGGDTTEYVVKLGGCMDTGVTGLSFELLGALLAAHFGIETPEPAVVTIDQTIANFIAIGPPLKECARTSVGENFGSRRILGGMQPPVDIPLPAVFVDAATRIIAFDALIDNSDRRYANPNLFVRGSDLIAYDHELAFSFCLAIAPNAEPWHLAAPSRVIEDHPLYRTVKGKSCDLSGFRSDLGALTQSTWEAMARQVPKAWENEYIEVVGAHLLQMASHAAEFTQQIQRRLS